MTYISLYNYLTPWYSSDILAFLTKHCKTTSKEQIKNNIIHNVSIFFPFETIICFAIKGFLDTCFED